MGIARKDRSDGLVSSQMINLMPWVAVNVRVDETARKAHDPAGLYGGQADGHMVQMAIEERCAIARSASLGTVGSDSSSC